jgi:hypothetical protein
MTLIMELVSVNHSLIAVAVNCTSSMHREIKNAKEKHTVFTLRILIEGDHTYINSEFVIILYIFIYTVLGL